MNIEKRLQDHYCGMQMDSGVLSQIIQTNTLTRIPAFTQRCRVLSKAVAALLLLSISVGMHQYGTNAERTLRTLNEAAMNHSTRLQLEYKADSISGVDQQMSQLQFKVALPSRFADQFNVIGSRYCTINGELAAHVKFVNKDTNEQISLFIAPSGEGLRTMDSTHEQINGVNVKLWVETGLFYAMASRSPLI